MEKHKASERKTVHSDSCRIDSSDIIQQEGTNYLFYLLLSPSVQDKARKFE